MPAIIYSPIEYDLASSVATESHFYCIILALHVATL